MNDPLIFLIVFEIKVQLSSVVIIVSRMAQTILNLLASSSKINISQRTNLLPGNTMHIGSNSFHWYSNKTRYEDTGPYCTRAFPQGK